jgi:hypothetical protein
MWKRAIGWFLFAYGIIAAIYSIATSPHIVVMIVLLLVCALCIWGGWTLAHKK